MGGIILHIFAQLFWLVFSGLVLKCVMCNGFLGGWGWSRFLRHTIYLVVHYTSPPASILIALMFLPHLSPSRLAEKKEVSR